MKRIRGDEVCRKFVIKILLLVVFLLAVPDSYAKMLDTSYFYSQEEKPEICFFPKDKARWDGYMVFSGDWGKLDGYQKNKFFEEGLLEIKEKEDVLISCEIDKFDKIAITQMIDKISSLSFSEKGGIPIIAYLYLDLQFNDCLIHSTGIKAQPYSSSMSKVNNSYFINIKPGNTYTGYIKCRKKDGIWLNGEEPPIVGGIIKQPIYADYLFYPRGKAVLSKIYPSNFDYKIKTFKNVFSFADQNKNETFCYEIKFVPVPK